MSAVWCKGGAHVVPTNPVQWWPMNRDELLWASRSMVSRNVGSHVLAATVFWSDESSTLELTYYMDRLPADDGAEQCELALTELIAEFSDIASAIAKCAHLPEGGVVNNIEGLVYSRS